MKAVFLLLLAVALSAPAARAAFISGRSYQPLADWADANGFRPAARRGDEIVLTNRTARLVFAKDSRTAQINGVNVALSFPVAADKGQFLVAQLDLAKTVGPLIFVPKFAGKKISTIVLDPGHGGKDPGNGNRLAGRNEKTATLALAGELRDQLTAAGFKVILTRTKDKFVELPVRPDIANRAHADLFVSLHFNATESGHAEVSGPETYCITPVGASSSNAQGEGANYGATLANVSEKKSLLLAYQVQRALVKNLGVPDRSVRRARFAVLRDAEMPAILVESGYMTHPVEGRKIFDTGYRKQIAAAMVK
ncbi:MAG TPA: N-acetylmuramoyl-L-alanine amidase, partial [Verrucomicrobiae bacterium]